MENNNKYIQTKGMGKNIVFDFDGVISCFKRGWEGEGTINEEPTPGIREVILECRKDGYRVVVMSTRVLSKTGMNAVKKWLQKHDIEVDEITPKKVGALLYIDDRAINFDGNTKNLKQKIDEFVPWTGRRSDGNPGDRF